MIELESEVPGSVLNEGNILLLEFFFSHCKACDANIGIVANVVCLWKTRLISLDGKGFKI